MEDTGFQVYRGEGSGSRVFGLGLGAQCLKLGIGDGLEDWALIAHLNLYQALKPKPLNHYLYF